MRLLAPASSLTDAIKLLQNGADDIYIGASSGIYNNYSFNGRSIRSKNGKIVSPDISEIEKICDYVHKNGGHVYFLANTPFLYDGQDKNNILLHEFLKHVEAGYKAGADNIVLGDIGAVKLVREKFPDFKVVVSSYLEVQNEYSLQLFQDMGVSQVILSYQSTLDEIKILTEKTNIKIEVFGHGGCSFYVGTCNMFHEMGEQPVDVGYPCRAIYHVTLDDKDYGECRVLDSFKMCSLCSLKELMDCKVNSLKLVGRDLESDYMLQLVRTYKKALNYIRLGEKIDSILKELPVWWIKAWCESGLCKYKA